MSDLLGPQSAGSELPERSSMSSRNLSPERCFIDSSRRFSERGVDYSLVSGLRLFGPAAPVDTAGAAAGPGSLGKQQELSNRIAGHRP